MVTIFLSAGIFPLRSGSTPGVREIGRPDDNDADNMVRDTNCVCNICVKCFERILGTGKLLSADLVSKYGGVPAIYVEREAVCLGTVP